MEQIIYPTNFDYQFLPCLFVSLPALPDMSLIGDFFSKGLEIV